MSEKTIGLVAAMNEEIQPLLRHSGKYTRENVAGFNLYLFTIQGRNAALIESGIGAARAADATGILINAAAPGIIINFGFAGAVLAGPTVGDVVIANRLLFFKERLFIEQTGLSPDLSAELASLLEKSCSGRDFRIHRGTFVTTGEIVAKRRLAGLLPAGIINPVVEMETTAVARIAARADIPLVAIRGVSDGADEELGFSIEEFTDREMNIRAWKVLRTVAVKPRIIPQLFRLARNSKKAGENLAIALIALLENLPTSYTS
jgi:adenosylhomocysteine nucleosidase